MPEAMNNIGNAYLNGTGVPQDTAQAITWYRQAAGAGFAKSMLKLAVLYESGQQGVPKDPDQARTWYARAAELDDEDAKNWLAAHGGK